LKIGGKRDGRYYDSQLSFDESKTRFYGKTFAWDRNCQVNGQQLKIITEPNVQGQLVLKKLPSYFVPICMRTNDKNFIGDWYLSGDLAKKDADGFLVYRSSR
jgi:acyl-coenzyme A synthetase/AMP-(fatty) acid ligase